MKRYIFSFLTIAVIVFASCRRDDRTFTVTFEANGGTPVPAAQTVKEGERATPPTPAPTLAEHIFGGWFTDDNTFANRWNFDVNTVTANVALYAKWDKVYAHDAGEWRTTLEPTCTDDGKKELRCTTCDELLDTEAIG